MGFCSSMFKFFVFLINFIFFVAGCGITGLGIYLHVAMKGYFDILGESSMLHSSWIFIIVGIAVLIVGFLGCCAACTENKCMMYSYAALVLLILLAEIAVAVLALVYKGQAKEIVLTALKSGQQNYQGEEHDGVTKSWDLIQNTFDCCGVDNYTDWKGKPFQNGVETTAPDSCCTNESEGCGAGQLTIPAGSIHTEGCYPDFEEFVESKIFLVGGIGIGIALFQLISVIIACCLGHKFGEKDQFV